MCVCVRVCLCVCGVSRNLKNTRYLRDLEKSRLFSVNWIPVCDAGARAVQLDAYWFRLTSLKCARWTRLGV